MDTNDGSKIKSIRTTGIYIDDDFGDIAISDDDSTIYISAKDSYANGYLCIYNTR